MRRSDNEKNGALTFRTDRFFKSEQFWYFTTREDVDMGPFPRQADAEQALLEYLDTQRTLARMRRREPESRRDPAMTPSGVARIWRDLGSFGRRRQG